MGIELSNDIKSLIDRPNFAHLATLMSDGSPQSVPVWVGRKDDSVLIGTGESSLKARNTLRDARVAISTIDLHNPYEEVQLRGLVLERRPDRDFRYMRIIDFDERCRCRRVGGPRLVSRGGRSKSMRG